VNVIYPGNSGIYLPTRRAVGRWACGVSSAEVNEPCALASKQACNLANIISSVLFGGGVLLQCEYKLSLIWVLACNSRSAGMIDKLSSFLFVYQSVEWVRTLLYIHVVNPVWAVKILGPPGITSDDDIALFAKSTCPCSVMVIDCHHFPWELCVASSCRQSSFLPPSSV